MGARELSVYNPNFQVCMRGGTARREKEPEGALTFDVLG